MKNYSYKNSNILRISYKSLIIDLINTFLTCLNHLKLPINYDILVESIKASSFRNVREFEKKMGQFMLLLNFEAFLQEMAKLEIGKIT
jgi:hypothetical protein